MEGAENTRRASASGDTNLALGQRQDHTQARKKKTCQERGSEGEEEEEAPK